MATCVALAEQFLAEMLTTALQPVAGNGGDGEAARWWREAGGGEGGGAQPTLAEVVRETAGVLFAVRRLYLHALNSDGGRLRYADMAGAGAAPGNFDEDDPLSVQLADVAAAGLRRTCAPFGRLHENDQVEIAMRYATLACAASGMR